MSDQNLLKSILSLWKVDYTDEIFFYELISESYYCTNCSIEFPSVAEVRSKPKLTTPDGPVEVPCISYPPDPDAAFYDKKKDEPKGTFKAMQDKGLKITQYKEESYRL